MWRWTLLVVCATSCAGLYAQDLLWRVEGINGQIRRGQELRRIGDCNGDGWEDLVEVGGDSVNGVVVRITSGRDGAVLSSSPRPPQWSVLNIQPLGDMNQDGIPDYGISTYDSGNPTTTRRIEVRSGSSHALLWSATIPNAGVNEFGAQFAGELDVNGDGRKDLVTIAPYLSLFGTIIVYDNSGIELYRIVSPLPNGPISKVSALFGDLDGDGCDDFLATGPQPPNAPYEAGAVIVFSGRTGAILRHSPGERAYDALRTPAGCGDLDGDGIPDYAACGWLGNSVVSAFSGATGQLIRSWRDPIDRWLGTCLVGRFDLDQDGVNDLVAGSYNTWANAMSGRDGTFLFRWRDSRYPGTACIGWSMVMLAPPPGEQYPLLVWSESCWNSPGGVGFAAGVIFAYRGCPPGVRAYGQPAASAGQQLPRSGMRTPTSPVVRFTLSSAAASASSLLLLGTSQTHLGSTALPLPLGPFGFPGAVSASWISRGTNAELSQNLIGPRVVRPAARRRRWLWPWAACGAGSRQPAPAGRGGSRRRVRAGPDPRSRGRFPWASRGSSRRSASRDRRREPCRHGARRRGTG